MGLIDTGVRFTLRLPEDLRDQLLIHANQSNRSMNSEIISILSKWLSSRTITVKDETAESTANYSSRALLLKECSSLSVAQAETLLVFLREWGAISGE